jgi:hypothetical protein
MAFNVDHPSSSTRADFALMEAGPGALERYWRLAVETSQYIKRLNEAGVVRANMWFDVHEAWRVRHFVDNFIPPDSHDNDLLVRWNDWGAEYAEIHRASPKWRLKEMISEVSETHHFCSWPNRWEKEIWKWAVTDQDDVRCPFDDRKGYLNHEFRSRLRELIEEVRGFLYLCEETRNIVFVQAADLERIWRHQDHLAEIDRNKPFGFFHDATRPNFQMRAPTDEEERMFAIMRNRSKRRKRWSTRLINYVRRVAS